MATRKDAAKGCWLCSSEHHRSIDLPLPSARLASRHDLARLAGPDVFGPDAAGLGDHLHVAACLGLVAAAAKHLTVAESVVAALLCRNAVIVFGAVAGEYLAPASVALAAAAIPCSEAGSPGELGAVGQVTLLCPPAR